MKEIGRSQVIVVQTSSGVNEQNSHSEGLLGAALLGGVMLVMFSVGVVFFGRSVWRFFNTRESTGPQGSDPTDASQLS